MIGLGPVGFRDGGVWPDAERTVGELLCEAVSIHVVEISGW